MWLPASKTANLTLGTFDFNFDADVGTQLIYVRGVSFRVLDWKVFRATLHFLVQAPARLIRDEKRKLAYRVMFYFLLNSGRPDFRPDRTWSCDVPCACFLE